MTFGGQWEPPGARGGDEVARVTVALARAGPQDLMGRLRVTAAVRGLRCDVVGLGPERLLRWVPKNPQKNPRPIGTPVGCGVGPIDHNAMEIPMGHRKVLPHSSPLCSTGSTLAPWGLLLPHTTPPNLWGAPWLRGHCPVP